MTGLDILKKAALLLDDTAAFSPTDADLLRLNEIGKDLCDFTEIANVNAEVTAPKRVLEAMPYGVAMLTAFARNESEIHAVFCDLYNAKRAAAKSKTATTVDVLPKAVDAL